MGVSGILGMKRGDVCPPGAIKPIARTLETILDGVNRGHALVDESLCLSFQGQSCGVCYRACPLPDIAITVGAMEQPPVTDKCVGRGPENAGGAPPGVFWPPPRGYG